MSDSSADLVGTPPGAVRVAQTIILDWYDGPREGFVWLAHPESGWHFTVFAEHDGDEEPDDNLFLLAPLPEGAREAVDEALRDVGPPSGPHWVPEWRFPDEERQLAAEGILDRLIAGLDPPTVVVRSSSLESIEQIWLRSDRRE